MRHRARGGAQAGEVELEDPAVAFRLVGRLDVRDVAALQSDLQRADAVEPRDRRAQEAERAETLEQVWAVAASGREGKVLQAVGRVERDEVLLRRPYKALLAPSLWDEARAPPPPH